MRFSPGQNIDRYEVLELLGEGAYAEIYKARDAASGQVVVLKCPNPLLFADPGLFQRYQREREIARTLDHPGVLHSLDDAGTRSEPSGAACGSWATPSPSHRPSTGAASWPARSSTSTSAASSTATSNPRTSSSTRTERSRSSTSARPCSGGPAASPGAI